MHTEYLTGQIHPESPVGDNPTVRGVISDAEVLFKESYGEQWPARATLQIGSGAVLRCTNHRALGQPERREVLLDVSLDREESRSAAESHVLFRAWLRREPSAEVVHSSIERVNTLSWMVEEFADGDWVMVLRTMAQRKHEPIRELDSSG